MAPLKTRCKEPTHACVLCDSEFDALMRPSQAYGGPISLAHFGARFRDFPLADFELFLDGEPAGSVAEGMLGDEGWVYRYSEHINDGEKTYRAVHCSDDGYRAAVCAELVYGSVRMIVKPQSARKMAALQLFLDTLKWVELAQDGNFASLIMTAPARDRDR